MTSEKITKITFSTDEVQAIHTVRTIALDLCELYCWSSDYDNSYIQNVNNEKRKIYIKNFEAVEELLDNLEDFIFENNKIHIVEE